MKIILWDLLRQAENWLAQEAKWERLDIVYKINTNLDLKNLPAILNNVPHDYVLIFENGQRTQIETLIPLGVRSDKLIFALDVESWLNHFDVASYILKSDSKSFLTIDFHHLRLKNPIFMYNVPCRGGG